MVSYGSGAGIRRFRSEIVTDVLLERRDRARSKQPTMSPRRTQIDYDAAYCRMRGNLAM